MQYVGCTTNILKVRIRGHLADAQNTNAFNISNASRHFREGLISHCPSVVLKNKHAPHKEVTTDKNFYIGSHVGFLTLIPASQMV